jgi:hypothetical protein
VKCSFLTSWPKLGGRSGDSVLWEVICFSQAYGSDGLHVVESNQFLCVNGNSRKDYDFG